MTHLAETALVAIETNLTGLVATGARVKRGLVWVHEAYPAITVQKGDDVVDDENEVLSATVRRLSFSVVCLVKQTGNVETALNAIAAEVYAALMADVTQGEAFIFDTALEQDTAPELAGEGDLPVARMVSEWVLLYEHSEASAEA